MKITQERFERTRAAVLVARDKRDTYRVSLCCKYGANATVHASWLTSAERKRREQLDAAYDRAANRMHALLVGTPRDWSRGVPAAWSAVQLSYEDAVRPLSEPLSVVPPCAYGCSEPIR